MANVYLDTTDAALAEAIGFMQVNTVSYKGQTFFGVCNEQSRDALAAGGYEQHFAGTIRIRKEGFPEPALGDRITTNGIERRIIKWDENPLTYKFYLEDISR